MVRVARGVGERLWTILTSRVTSIVGKVVRGEVCCCRQQTDWCSNGHVLPVVWQ